MTGLAPARAGVDRVLGALLVTTALAWLLTWQLSIGSGMAGGPMLLPWMVAWVPMVAALMLPSVIPTVRLWVRVQSAQAPQPDRRMPQLAGFVTGYLVVWAVTGLPSYGLAALGRQAHHVPWIRVVNGLIVVLAAVYQLSRLKRVCLNRCRSPLASLLHYAAWSGPLRNLRVGLAHGGYCTACCWGLMAVTALVSAMDLRLAAAMAAAVILEKSWRHGERFAVALGVVLLALAPVFAFGAVTPAPM